MPEKDKLQAFQRAVSAVQSRNQEAVEQANKEAELLQQEEIRRNYNRLHNLPQYTRFIPSNGGTVSTKEGPLYNNKLEKYLDETASGQEMVRIANTAKKAGVMALGIAGGNWLLKGLKTAPLLTSGEFLGGTLVGGAGQKVGKDADNLLHTRNQILDFEDVLPFAGMIGGAKLIKEGASYTNGVLNRAAESVVRLGDQAQNIPDIKRLFKDKNTWIYVLNPKRKDLAYNLLGKYSGESAEQFLKPAHPGDVVDIFFGKVKPENATYDISILDNGMQNYIKRFYKDKIGKIPIIDLGEAYRDFETTSLNLKDGETIRLGADTGKIWDKDYTTPILDPGGYNVKETRVGKDVIKENLDIWKFNPYDYNKRYLSRINMFDKNGLRSLGLRFVDSRGTPVVHKWKSIIKDVYKQGGILKGQKGIPYLNILPSPKDSTFKLKPIQGLEKPKIEQKPIKTVSKFKQFINNVKFNLNKTDRSKAIGTYSFAYKQPTKVVENGGNVS